jgi:hypothetical protein
MGLEAARCDCWPLVVAAEGFGAPQRRKRAFILARNQEDGSIPPEAIPSATVTREMLSVRSCWDRLKQELGVIGNPASDPSTAGGIVKELQSRPDWTERYRCCGNSVVWLIPALIGLALLSLATAPGGAAVGEGLRAGLAANCQMQSGVLSVEWGTRKTPGGRPYHELKTRWEDIQLAVDADGKPPTRVAGTPSALMPLVTEWQAGRKAGREARILPDKKGQVAEGHQQQETRERQLAPGDGDARGGAEPRAAPDTRAVRKLHGNPPRVDRYRRGGNNFIPGVPAAPGRYDDRRLRAVKLKGDDHEPGSF